MSSPTCALKVAVQKVCDLVGPGLNIVRESRLAPPGFFCPARRRSRTSELKPRQAADVLNRSAERLDVLCCLGSAHLGTSSATNVPSRQQPPATAVMLMRSCIRLVVAHSPGCPSSPFPSSLLDDGKVLLLHGYHVSVVYDRIAVDDSARQEKRVDAILVG